MEIETKVEEAEKRFKTRTDLYAENRKELRRIDRLASTLAISLEDYKYALKKFEGNQTKAAKFLGLEREVLARKVRSTPSLRRFLQNLEEEIKDMAEEKLVGMVKQSVLPAVTFFLKTKAKDRGYTEKVETTSDPATLASNAAALIEAMKQGARKSLPDKDTEAIEVEDYTWEDKEAE